jgi:hypothetical protein
MSGFQLVDTRPRTEIGVEFLDEGFVPEEQT